MVPRRHAHLPVRLSQCLAAPPLGAERQINTETCKSSSMKTRVWAPALSQLPVDPSLLSLASKVAIPFSQANAMSTVACNYPADGMSVAKRSTSCIIATLLYLWRYLLLFCRQSGRETYRDWRRALGKNRQSPAAQGRTARLSWPFCT